MCPKDRAQRYIRTYLCHSYTAVRISPVSAKHIYFKERLFATLLFCFVVITAEQYFIFKMLIRFAVELIDAIRLSDCSPLFLRRVLQPVM